MSDASSLVLSPNRARGHGDLDSALTATTASSVVRRPRNREVTSRYRTSAMVSAPSPAPAPSSSISISISNSSSNRRYPTPQIDRAGNASDVASPKRALSAERRRPSPPPPRLVSESKVPKAAAAPAPPVPPRRTLAPAELLWPSSRSLSSSMVFEPQSLLRADQAKQQIRTQSKSVSDQTLKPSANVATRTSDFRKPTPERKATTPRRSSQNTDQAENARPQENVHGPDHHHFPRPAGGSVMKLPVTALSRSVDLSADREKFPGRASTTTSAQQVKSSRHSAAAPRSVSSLRARQSATSEGSVCSTASSAKARSESRGRRPDSPLSVSRFPNKDSPSNARSHATDLFAARTARHAAQAVDLACSEGTTTSMDNVSDTDSVSSGGTATTTSSSGWGTPGGAPCHRVRGTTVPARFLQDAAARSRRATDSKLRTSMPEVDVSMAIAGKALLKYKTMDSPQGSSSFGNGSVSSPWSVTVNRSASAFLSSHQPQSPSLKCSPYRSSQSPLRSRGTAAVIQSQRTSTAAVMLNFGADMRKGRKGLSQVEEIHLHRILHNRLLQWRFVNARAQGAMTAQRFAAEKSLYNVCVRIFDLRSSVTRKKIKLLQARQAQKLNTLLSVQTPMLDDWSSLQNEHAVALKGIVQALEAAVLRVPVTVGVKADAFAVKNAVNSAFDVMNSVEKSVTCLLPKAHKTNSLLSELGHIAAQERLLLEECASLLATMSALQVEECSMQTHLVQFEHEKSRVLGHLMDNSTSI